MYVLLLSLLPVCKEAKLFVHAVNVVAFVVVVVVGWLVVVVTVVT